MSLKDELVKFDIDLDEVKEANDFTDRLQEAIDKMQEHGYYENLEVILNENLIQIKEKYHDVKTIFGCKISYEQLEENISFIVKPCFEKSANKMFKELGYEEKNFDTGIINFIKEYGKETQSNIHFWEEEKTISKNGDIDSVRITMQELKTINKKCEELGWI